MAARISAVDIESLVPGAALEALDRTAKELSLSRSGAIAYLALERQALPRRHAGKARSKPSKKSTKVG